MTTPASHETETTYTVKRLTVAVPGVREFQECYEQAVPALPLEQRTARLAVQIAGRNLLYAVQSGEDDETIERSATQLL